MRKLTKREKLLLAFVGVIILVIVALRLLPSAFQGFSGGELAEKRGQLQTARDLVQLSKFAEQIEERLRAHVGLQGQIISDSLFEEISEQGNVKAFNQARRTADLAALHPALQDKAATLIAYKQQHGELESMNALREIQGPIFEGEQPQAVISQRISQLSRNAGLKPDYQLNIKPSPGRKVESIPPQAKQNVVLYLYLSQLDAELKQLRGQHQAEVSQKEAKKEEELEHAIFDGWWSGDAWPQTTDKISKNSGLGPTASPKATVKSEIQRLSPTTSNLSESESETDASHQNGQNSEIQTASAEDVVKNNIQPSARTLDEAPESKSEMDAKQGLYPSEEAEQAQLPPKYSPETENRPFAHLSEIIPGGLRRRLIEFIHARSKMEMEGAVEFKRGFIADQIVRVHDESQRGFAGLGARTSVVQVRFRKNSILLAKFEELSNQYEEEQPYASEESTEDSRAYVEQVMALTEYIDKIERQMKQLQGWFAKVNSTYQPQIYSIEMKFNSEVDALVNLMQSIEVSTKWLYVKNIKLTNDKTTKDKSRLAVDLSMTAKIL